MKGPLVSVIIATLNGKGLLSDCLKTLYKYESNFEVIVVDNDSTDGTISWLKKSYPQVKLIENSFNTGFAKANNQGLELASGEYVLYLNNDTLITEPFLKTLIAELVSPKVAAVSPLILLPDGTIDSIGSYLTRTGFLYHRAHRHKPDPSFVHKTNTYSLKGACMLWKKSVLDKIGQLDESYFAYFEETDLCHRAVNAGFNLMVVPQVSIIHLGGMTSNKIPSSFIQYHSYKNRIRTYIQNLPFFTLMTVLPIHLLLCLLAALKFGLKVPKVGLAVLKGIFMGIFLGLLNRNYFSKKANLSKLTINPDWRYYYFLFKGLEQYEKIY